MADARNGGRAAEGVAEYVLLGCPTGGSASPAMQNAAFRALGLAAEYRAVDVPGGAREFRRALERLVRAGIRGGNVTQPHKAAAWRYCSAHGKLTDAAQALRSVNTFRVGRDGTVTGENTDAPGFLEAYRRRFGEGVAGRRVLVLGVGGAGRAVALACLFRGARVSVAAREAAARRRWALELRKAGPGLGMETMTFAEAQRRGWEYDVVVQATPVGVREGDPPLLTREAFREGQRVVDLVYSRAETPLMKEAAAAGAETENGIEMLVAQGTRAFRFWTHRAAPESAMREGLAAALEAGTAARRAR